MALPWVLFSLYSIAEIGIFFLKDQIVNYFKTLKAVLNSAVVA